MAKNPSAGKSPSAAKTYGRYRVLSPLGQGAMASVFLAEDPSLGRLVAIKVIHSHLAAQADLLTRFTAEAKTAASLRTPNIVEVFDYGLEGAAQYLVMEYIDGPTLQQVLNLQMGAPLSARLTASLVVQAAEGLMVAERKSVVHRDIKPENLMLTSAGLLKIADFGIAHINEQNLTRTGSILGSPSYMAPEQVEGGKPSHQTDMFALGAIFYACLTGRKPFNGPNIPSIFRAICELPHIPVLEANPDCDPQLAALVETLLSKAPEDRGAGAKALSGQLRQWLNQQGLYDPSGEVHQMLSQLQPHGERTLLEGPESVPASAAKPKSGAGEKQVAAAKPKEPKEDKALATSPKEPGRESFSISIRAITIKPATWLILGMGAGIIALLVFVVLLMQSRPPPEPPAPKVDSVEKASRELNEDRAMPTPVAPVALDTPQAKPIPAQPGMADTVAKAETVMASTQLSVISSPPFAEIFLDGRYLGNTPMKGKIVASGRYKMLISHKRFASIDTVVRLRPGPLALKFRFSKEKMP